jgi:ATP-dependent Lon protease
MSDMDLKWKKRLRSSVKNNENDIEEADSEIIEHPRKRRRIKRVKLDDEKSDSDESMSKFIMKRKNSLKNPLKTSIKKEKTKNIFTDCDCSDSDADSSEDEDLYVDAEADKSDSDVSEEDVEESEIEELEEDDDESDEESVELDSDESDDNGFISENEDYPAIAIGFKRKRERAYSDHELRPVDKLKQTPSAKRSFGDLVEDIMDSANKCADKFGLKWGKRLTDEEKEKYIPLLQKIKGNIKERMISETDIVTSTLPMDDKCWLVEHLGILRNIEPNTEEHYELKKQLFDKIKRAKPLTEEDFKIEEHLKEICNESISLQQRIVRSDVPDKIKATIYNKFLQIKDLSCTDEEFVKGKTWIDWALSIPQKTIPVLEDAEIDEKRIEYFKKLKSTLDSEIHGQKTVKEKVTEVVAGMISNPDGKYRCIALLGPPGTGKTALGRALANSLGLPFEQLSLGGVNDTAFLTGHSATYVSAKPGAMVEVMRRLKYKNGILLLDEFDKIQDSLGGREVISALLHIIDYTQNTEFKDIYLSDIPVDLSKLFFVLSLNDDMLVDSVLRDRMPIIRMEEYKIPDRLEIALNHFIPRNIKNFNFKEGDVTVTKEGLRRILNKVKREKGVRNLERAIHTLFARLNTLKQMSIGEKVPDTLKPSYYIHIKFPLEVTADIVDKLVPYQETIDPSISHLYI